MKLPCVYILASKPRGTLYLGVTSILCSGPGSIRTTSWRDSRSVTVYPDKSGLVWFEAHESMESAIAREKAIKEWKRVWKVELIEKGNPPWRDLYDEIV